MIGVDGFTLEKDTEELVAGTLRDGEHTMRFRKEQVGSIPKQLCTVSCSCGARIAWREDVYPIIFLGDTFHGVMLEEIERSVNATREENGKENKFVFAKQ